ncbi:MAG TPA: hypothetical protein VJN18_31945 [Polyangiaceae bacterium]|nr:hypothetical protein [Polyangiaceae bacterium]
MTLGRFGLVMVVMLRVLFGCGPAPRPSGLPPPEYEQPRVEPWPPPGAAAGSAGAASVAPPETAEAPEPVLPAASTSPPPAQNAGGSSATLPAGTP